MTRSLTTAQTQQNSGAQVPPFVAGKNKIINGDFGVWQRGTSFTPTNNTYTADRWGVTFGGSGTLSCSQQSFTPGTAPVAGYESAYFLRMSVTTVSTISSLGFFQGIEDVRTFAGQTVTFSLWAKADSARTITLGFGQGFGSGGSAFVGSIGSTNINIGTTWARYSATIAIPSVAGKTIGAGSALYSYIITGQASGLTVDIWGVQVEAGSVATAFQTATGTVQGELAACQRYYWRQTSEDVNTAMFKFVGQFYSAGNYSGGIHFPVTMRSAPQAIEIPAASNFLVDDMSASNTMSSIATNSSRNTKNLGYIYGSVTSGGTAYRTAQIYANSTTSAYIGWSAEL